GTSSEGRRPKASEEGTAGPGRAVCRHGDLISGRVNEGWRGRRRCAWTAIVDRAEPHPPVAAVILVTEPHALLVESDQPAVRDGDTVGVAGEIGEHRLGAGEGRLGVDEPVLVPQRREIDGEGRPAA